uniref:Uncharacterized protein n=1 Tax=Vitis vinifera TaxID=29760 RepID=F6HNN6_VITVI
MPLVVLLLLILTPLSTDLKDSSLFNLYFHFLLLHPWKIRPENMSFWRLFPGNSRVGKAEVSLTVLGMLEREMLNGKPSKGSQRSREKGSKMLLHRPPPRTLGMSDIFYGC